MARTVAAVERLKTSAGESASLMAGAFCGEAERHPTPTLPRRGQGYRIWQRRAFPPLPSGRGGDPSRLRWEGEGELPPPCLLQETTRKLRAPLTLPRLRRGSLPLPDGARGYRRFGQMQFPCPRGGGRSRSADRKIP